jgi:Flp pilus assembly CpaE family ATPase
MHQIVLVATTSVSSLHQAKRTLTALLNAGQAPEKLRLAINAVPGGAEVGEAAMKQMFATPVSTLIPECCAELRDATTRGALPGLDTKYRQAVSSLARTISGMPLEKQRSGTLSQLLSLGGRLKKSPEPRVTT